MDEKELSVGAWRETRRLSQTWSGATKFRSYRWPPGCSTDREEARDAVQDALLRVYVNLRRFDPARSFRTWGFSIAYKRCLDKLRRRKSCRRLFGTWANGGGLRPKGLVEDVPFSDQSLRVALARLNGPERAALHLRLTEDRTAREIAGVLGCSESTARVHLFHAKMKLRKILRKGNHMPDYGLL